MALVHADRVKETSTTTGTGTYSLAGAVTGFQTFVAGVGTGNLCYYVAEDGTDWELGLGTVTDASPDTLARTRVFESSNADAAVNWAAGTRTLFCAPIAEMIRNADPPKGYLWDLTTLNAGADPTNDITINPGEATDETGEVVMVLGSVINKQIDAAWAVGTDAGGMNTGSVANATWYEVILIQRQDTGVVDVMFSTTANRDTLPTNYTHKRRIGWVRRGTATNLAFAQDGDYFTLTTQINDATFAMTTTATAVRLTVPPNTIARFRANIEGDTAVVIDTVIVFSEISEGNVTPSEDTGISSLGAVDAACSSAGHFELRVDSSSRIEHDSSVADASIEVNISTYGWIDDRQQTRNV